MPTGVAPHKVIERDPGATVRLEMTRLAAADDPRLEVSAVEVERPGPSYMVETLEALAAEHPGDEFHLLLGADAAAGLASWHRPERVLGLATPAVAHRGEVSMAEVREVLQELGYERVLQVLEMPPFGVSSSLIRERVGRGMPIRYLVPDRVAAMIESESIYRESSDGDS